MKVITLAKTKELLGIDSGDTSQDDAITAKIPIIDAKVKQITRNRYNMQIQGDTITGSPYVEVYSITIHNTTYRLNRSLRRFDAVSGIQNPYYLDDLAEFLEIGTLISGSGIPADSYVDEVFYDGYSLEISGNTYAIPFLQLNASATETANGVQLFLGFNVGLQDIVAKGIQYLINGTNTSIPTNSLASRSLGPSSKSFSQKDQEIDNRYGMPAWFVKGLPRYHGGH